MLKSIYASYVEHVVKNPAYTMGDTIDCQLFVTEATNIMKHHPSYN